MSLFYIKNNGQVTGPFDAFQIKEMKGSGKLNANATASLNGEDGWFPVSAVLDRHHSGAPYAIRSIIKECGFVLAAVVLFAMIVVIFKML